MAAEDLTGAPVAKVHFNAGFSGKRAGVTPQSDGLPRNIGHEFFVAVPNSAKATNCNPITADKSAKPLPADQLFLREANMRFG